MVVVVLVLVECVDRLCCGFWYVEYLCDFGALFVAGLHQ